MVRISVISPLHNEESIVNQLMKRTSDVLSKNYRKDWEFILVDDVSTDSTPAKIKKMSQQIPNIRYVRLDKRGGQTGAFKAGFDNAKGSIIVTMDGDLQVFPEDIPLFIQKIEAGYDVVNGIREHRQHDFWLRFVSRFYNMLMLLFFNSPVLDAASNYMACRSKYVKKLDLIGNDHRYLIPIFVRRGAKRIGEVVIRHAERKGGKSKYKLSKKLVRGGPEIIRAWVRYKRGKYDY